MEAGQRWAAAAIGAAVLARPPKVQQLVGTAAQIAGAGRGGRVPRRRVQRAVAVVRVLRIVEGTVVAGGAAVPTDRYGFGGNAGAGNWPDDDICARARECVRVFGININRERGSRRQKMGRDEHSETNTWHCRSAGV